MFQNPHSAHPHSAHEIARIGPDSLSGGVASAGALRRCTELALFSLFVAVIWSGLLLF